MDYQLTIPDGIDWGIGAARAAYNEARPEEPIDTDAAYVEFVMQHAAASYCLQYPEANPNPEATQAAIEPYMPH